MSKNQGHKVTIVTDHLHDPREPHDVVLTPEARYLQQIQARGCPRCGMCGAYDPTSGQCRNCSCFYR